MVDELRELEGLEHEAWHSMFLAAPRPFAAAAGLVVERWDEALFTHSRLLDANQFNRLQGLGVDGRGADGRIARALEAFHRAGSRNFFVQIAPGAGHAAAATEARRLGLVPYVRCWAKFRRGPEFMTPPATDLRVEPVGHSAARAGDFGTAVARGFDMPPAMTAWLAATVLAPGWSGYVLYDGTTPVGGGAHFRHGHGAWLGIASVVPEARRRGGQSALLARRINDAAADGATLLTVETGTASPGEPQTSFRRIQQAGFEVAYERENWVPA